MFERKTLPTAELKDLLTQYEEQWGTLSLSRSYSGLIDSVVTNPIARVEAYRQHVASKDIPKLVKLGITLLHRTLGEAITLRLLAFGAATVTASLFFMGSLHPSEQQLIKDVQSTVLVNAISTLALNIEPTNAVARATGVLAALELPMEYSHWLSAHVNVAIKENSVSIN